VHGVSTRSGRGVRSAGSGTFDGPEKVTPQPRAVFATAEMAIKPTIGALRGPPRPTFRWLQYVRHYSRGDPCGGTLMRYFLLLARSKAALTGGVGQASRAARCVTCPGATQGRLACLDSTITGAINLATIAPPADQHLTLAASTEVETKVR